MMTEEETKNWRTQVESVRRTADMLCTAHSGLRDRYATKAFWLDTVVLTSSIVLVALTWEDFSKLLGLTGVFASQEGVEWGLRLLAILILILSIIQLNSAWKARSDAHQRSAKMYSEVKREAGYLLASFQNVTPEERQRLLSRYDMASDVGTGIPELEFLRQKKRHRLKVACSRRLDTHPATVLWMYRLRIWLRDNFGKEDSSP